MTESLAAVESNGALKEFFPIVYGMNYGRIGTLWSPASALVRFCAYGAAGIMILGVIVVAACLSAPRITKLFRYVQDAPEKMFRLIGRNRF